MELYVLCPRLGEAARLTSTWLNCGFLEHLPGDMVMVDWGFTISESVGLKQAKLVVPAFTKGKSQLDPADVGRTKGIASVRIHVERVIGSIMKGPLGWGSSVPRNFGTHFKFFWQDSLEPIPLSTWKQECHPCRQEWMRQVAILVL